MRINLSEQIFVGIETLLAAPTATTTSATGSRGRGVITPSIKLYHSLSSSY